MDRSINGKIVGAYRLSSLLGDAINAGELKVDKDVADMVWGHADGLVAKHLINMMNGWCSIQASIDFDVEERERILDAEITEMQELVDSLEGK